MGMKQTKMQKWTLALAAVGLVSIPVGAEEQPSPILTALSSTTISGYVNVSAIWNPGTGNANVPPYAFNYDASNPLQGNKADGFNLDVVRLTIERPLDEAQWSAGYKADLIFGPDADFLATQSTGVAADFGIKQAYVAVRAPVGNGLDFKLGVWDTIIGYESFDAGSNPNYTRSYGYTVEPTTHTGILMTYQLLDSLGFSAGVADTMGPRINARSTRAESQKTYMGSLAYTVPENAGFLAGSTVYTGVIEGFGSPTEDQMNFYLGATINTPVTGVKVGAAFDYVDDLVGFSGQADARVYGAYISFQATEKMSIHGRAEYADVDDVFFGSDIFALTGTVQYDLWKNVLSRLEVRWDHNASGNETFGGTVVGSPDLKNYWTIAANLIYKF
jgi:hypothetical protein